MPRFHCPVPLAAGATIDLPEHCAHHVHVLRLAAGDEIVLFDGVADGQWTAALTEAGKKRASARLLRYEPVGLELPYAVTVAQALPEASKMDWIIEKAIELGAAGIAPLAAQRSVVRLSGERAEKRHAHWERVIAAATEQSGRARLARLEPVRELNKALAAIAGSPSRHLLLTPRAGRSLPQWAASEAPCDVTLLIGPEGGFTPQEEQAAAAAGAIALGMGPRILRTETAALAALAALAACWGGM